VRTPLLSQALAFGIAVSSLSGCVSSSFPSDARDVRDVLAQRASPAALAALAAGDGLHAPEIVKPPDRPLTADDAVQLALANNREVWAALHELGVARGRAEQAGLLPNPEVEIGLRAPDSPQPLQADLGLELKLSEMLLVPQKQGVAEAELSAERLRVAGEVLDIAYRARVAFFEAQAARQRLDLRTRLLESFQAGHVTAEELSRAGNLPEVDVATRKAAVEAARIDVAEAELAALETRERLNAALGLSGEATRWTTVDLAEAPDKPALETAAVEKQAIASSLELAHLARQAEAAGRRAGLARTAGILPHLEGGLHGEHDGSSWEIGAHLTVGLPVFDRGQGREAAARAEVLSLRERYVATAVGLRAAARSAMNRVESAAARAKHYRSALLPARKKALSETVLQYNAMQIGVFRVLDAEREITGAAVGYLDTLLEYHVARAGLDQILAGRHRGVMGGAAASSGMRMGGMMGGEPGDAH
jgi:cobalt-zinc-cadmium efflux system outer membrane protein